LRRRGSFKLNDLSTNHEILGDFPALIWRHRKLDCLGAFPWGSDQQLYDAGHALFDVATELLQRRPYEMALLIQIGWQHVYLSTYHDGSAGI